MDKATLLPLEELTDNSGLFITSDGEAVDLSDCPFPFFEEPQYPAERLYKIYNDGGHYVATPYFHSYGRKKNALSPLERVFAVFYNDSLKKQRKYERCHNLPRKPLDESAFMENVLPILRARFPQSNVTKQAIKDMIRRLKARLIPEEKIERKSACNIAFDSLYLHTVREDMDELETMDFLKDELSTLFPDTENIDEYVMSGIEKKKRNLFARKKRFRRKANLNRWNYFVTFTYDDNKQSEESFRKKLRKCLCNFHTRRGWKYMGVFERAPETGRLHFHGLLYVPDGQMVGELYEDTDYSTAQGKMQTRVENSFFEETFGRNDFEEMDMIEMRNGHTLEYILKYIEKTGERVVYSRGIPTQVCKALPESEIVGRLEDFLTKYVLFDDSIDWERDIMRYKWKQVTMIDLLCNYPQTA